MLKFNSDIVASSQLTSSDPQEKSWIGKQRSATDANLSAQNFDPS